MIVSRCPRCHEPFRLDSDAAPPDALGHCPWCRESFPVAEVLATLPPVLELTSADGQPIVGPPGQANPSDGGVAGNHEKLTAVPVGHDRAGPLASESWSDGGTPDPRTDSGEGFEPVAPMQVTGPRPSPTRRKNGAPIRTVIGVALGGILALPLAGGILLALGKAPNLGFYPFDGSYGRQSSSGPFPSALSSPQRQSSPSTRPAADPQSTDAASDQPSEGRSLSDDLPDAAPSPSDDPAQQVAQEIVRRAKPAESIASDGPEQAVGSAELTDAVDAAMDQLVTFSQQRPSGVERKRMLATTYASLARVGALAEPKDRDAVAPLIEQLKSTGLARDFGAAAPQWLKFRDRPHDGAVLVGELARQSSGWEITLDSGPAVSVSIQGTEPAGMPNRVVALGKIIESAAHQSVQLVVTEPLSEHTTVDQATEDQAADDEATEEDESAQDAAIQDESADVGR